MPLQKTVSFEPVPKEEPFKRALDEYVNRRGKKSKTPQFIADLQKSPKLPNKDDVNDAMKKLEKETTDSKVTRNIRKILRPVIRVLDDYSGVVETMSNADPMPTAIIWGCMKVVISTSQRYLNLYDDIKDQLDELTIQLNILTEYEELFGKSQTMQELLQMSYIDVIRFWVRVDKECHRCVANRMGRALSSFSTSKLDGIIKDIERNAARISQLVPVVQERLQRGERENAAEERRLAGIARDQQTAFIEKQLEELKLRAIARKSERQKDVRNWLRGHTTLNESNFRHQEQNLKRRSPDTCSWLSSNQLFKDWTDPDTGSRMLWVKAAPGVGKSVLCAYAIQKLSETNPSSSPVYQYYSFDEVFSSLQVYRSIAEQLANRLWTHLEDMPEDIHSFTQHTTTAGMTQDVKTLIKMMLEQLPSSFLFLDGIDEECDMGPRMEAVSDILEFFTALASCSTKSYNLHLWCSSQDRTDLVPYMAKFSVIEISKDTNSADIESYLSKSIMKLDSLDLDEGYQNLILQDLREKADGCFLWAALMLDSVSKAKTLSAVQSKVDEGLPTSYEKYYLKKIESIEASERIFVSKLLACIVHAKRPLRLDELCESIAVLGTDDCSNVNRLERLRPNMVLKLCQPLVQIEDVVGAGSAVPICTLTHASVRKFLVKNPQILSTSESPAACWITEEVMANVCLKYLWQPRYQRLLTKSEDTFKDHTGEDIMEHHLLSYAAKYWDKHLDNVPYTEKLCSRVKSFILSEQFYTCLQVQSLFVGGQFQFWLSANRMWAGLHLRRVFPFWLQSHCDQQLELKYSTFVGEWGHVLDEVTNISGQYPGEIDRCLWGSLGPKNFLHNGPSKYKSFRFEDAEQEETSEMPHRFYDAIDKSGENYVVLKLENLGSNSEELEFTCQQWILSSRRPKLKLSQKLIASRSDWCLYDHPTAKKLLGRPVPVSLTDDLQYLRIGSQIFSKRLDKYAPLKVFDEGETYFEEISGSGPYLALSSRQKVLHEDLASEPTRDKAILDYGVYLAELIQKIAEAQDESAKASTAPTTDAETRSSRSSVSSSNTSVTSLLIEDEEEVKPSTEEEIKVEEVEEWEEASDISSDGNSAETEWSEGSTVGEFEELDDDDQWNDWGNERLAIEDLNNEIDEYSHPDQADDDEEVSSIRDDDLSSFASESGDELEGLGLRTEAEMEMLISGVPGFVLKRALASEEGSDSDSVESHYSHSYYSSSESGEEDEYSEIDNENAHKLEDLMLGRNALKGKDSRRISLRIFNTTTGDHTPIFHYSQRVVGNIFHSPPVFHPSKPLLVWALGNGEILFANFERNTYFTRKLCCSTYHSCHIFVKTQFSPCGGFVHFAALEGRPADDASKMHLSLQVSTHRLSTRKTASSPPKLVFRTAVPLGESSSMSVSRLPYTLTWTPKEVYLVTRGTQLDVVKIPLFKACEGETATPICYTQNPVYLPRSAESRNVYYFPPSLSSKSKKDKVETAKVILGSHSSIPSQGLIVPRKHMVQPPIGFLVKEETDLGGWKCKSLDASQGRGKERINLEGGRLQGKFESFDLKEDCDIVPFLS
ncbi:hypothetical protein ACMFMG_005658 [Clarireedia jacksonii]